jgi:membrane protease subunit HflK
MTRPRRNLPGRDAPQSMPWNDNANPGPWGSPPPPNGGDDDRRDPPRRPGGRGGGPRRPEGPDLSTAFDRLSRAVRQMFSGPGGQGVRPGAVALAAGVGVGLWALSGLYIVQPSESAVVTTFGSYSRSESPGLRYHLPAPIERVEKVAITSLQRTDIGGSAGADVPEESLMLTGDENIIDIEFSVTWRIADPARFLFNVADPEASVKAAAESAMREVVGKTEFTDITTTGRGKVQSDAVDLMQRMLDSWRSGVTVVEVQIRNANPPTEVGAAFRDVRSAEQDRASAVNEATSYRNRVVNEAKGDAARTTQSALAYREQAVREALGEASRFDQIYGEYRRAPGVTRDRLYIETMQRVLARSNKVVVDSEGASAPIILPPDVFKPRSATVGGAPVLEPAAPGPRPTPPAVSAGGAR